jgi:hypothetical protein
MCGPMRDFVCTDGMVCERNGCNVLEVKGRIRSESMLIVLDWE